MNYFDLHCDTPYEIHKKCLPFKNGDCAVNKDKGEIFDKWCTLCAVWVPDDEKEPQKRFLDVSKNFKAQTDIFENREDLTKDTCFMLTLEGGSPIKNVSDVDMLYSHGVRVVTLTWNGKNKIAGGANTKAPLTSFGKKVIKRMNELGMVIDLSHINDVSFFDALSLSNRVVATHSCCRSIANVPRNLTDEQIKAIIDKKGIIGICLYPRFLGGDNVFEAFSRHFSHILSLGGEDAVAIGSDFDGALMAKELDSVDKIPKLYKYLSKNYDKQLLDKLFYDNAFNFFWGSVK
ncbi:MAG: membrane dipeptidase [Clostridia bacterium]|nr:membrane dipeptidase [Clostridia bacterium]MBQ2274770.1 membrane dipeptidase [Clostridia bacterium]